MRAAGERLWELLERAKATEVWVVLGRASWEEWLAADVGISRNWATRMLAHAKTVRAIERAAGGPVPEPSVRATEAFSDRRDAVVEEVAQRVRSGEPAEVVVPEVVQAHRRGSRADTSRSAGGRAASEQLTLDLTGAAAALVDADVEAFARAVDRSARRRLARLIEQADRLDRPAPAEQAKCACAKPDPTPYGVCRGCGRKR